MPATKTKKLTNEEFNALPKAQQRVLIAKDVISQTKLGRYKLERYTWCDFSSGFCKQFQKLLNKNPNAECELFQKMVLQKTLDCRCCGLGACLISRARLGNTVGPPRRDDSFEIEDIGRYLKDIFNEQMQLIETAFECGEGCYSNNRATEFGLRYKSNKARLNAIMKNIIENEGDFKP